MTGAGAGQQAAVCLAVEESLGWVASSGVEAVQAGAALRRVVRWASWRLLGWDVATIAALVLLWWLASNACWWDAGVNGAMQLHKAQLEVDVATIQANHDDRVKAGMLEHCEP